MATKTYPFDPAEMLDSPEALAEYLSLALAENDLAAVVDALGVVARARGMAELAREAGLQQEHLCKALSPGGDPDLDTVVRVARALGLRLSVEPARAA